MTKHFSLLTFLVLILISNMLIAQEKKDSLELSTPVDLFIFKPGIFDPNLHYKTDDYLAAPDYKVEMVKNIFQGKEWNQFKLIDQIKYTPDGKLFLLYSSPTNALHYFGASDPIYFGIDFHLKPITKWEKLDIYLYGNGLLVNHYTDINPQPASHSTRNFYLEGGSGIEYEFREENFLFYERSGVFRNQTFTGWRNKAGFRVRF